MRYKGRHDNAVTGFGLGKGLEKCTGFEGQGRRCTTVPRHFSKRPCKTKKSVYNAQLSAPVAQLDRVLGYEPRGQEFESLRARQIKAEASYKFYL